MTRLYIGDFAIWEQQDDGKTNYHYLDKKVLRLNQRQIPVIDIIISNSKQYENSIQSADIAKSLDESYDKEIVKKIIQAVKKDEKWKEAIEGSHSGYRIKLREADVDVNTSQELDSDGDKGVDSEAQFITKTKADNSNTAVSNRQGSKTDVYIANFKKDNKRIRTYYYEKTPHEVSKVFRPISLRNTDDNTDIEISFEHLYENEERHRYVISGPIGSGKTLLARSLAIEAAECYSKRGIVPIILNLRSFSGDEKSLFDIIKTEYESYIPDDEPNLAEVMIKAMGHSEFSSLCSHGAVLLLIDSLDALNPEIKGKFITLLNGFMRSYSNNTIVIFSRPISKFTELESFTVLNIGLLTQEQATQLVDSFISPYNNVKKHDFRDAIVERHMNFLITPLFFYANPLYLSILSLRFKKNGFYSIPSLFNTIEAFIKYATCEDQANRYPRFSKVNLTPPQLREELSRFCDYLVEHNIESFDLALMDYYREQTYGPLDEFPCEEFLDDLCRMYGLTRYVDGKYEFIDNAIVEHFFVRYVFTHGVDLSYIPEIIKQCHAYSVDNILDMLYEMNSAAIRKEVYVPIANELTGTGSDKFYEQFLYTCCPKLSYYVGEGDYEVPNYRYGDIYKHMIRDFEVEQAINHLKFPPIESLKQHAVYKLNKTNAKKMGSEEGLIEDWLCDKEILQSLKIKPVGYVYTFNVHNALYGKDDASKSLRDVLMSKDFPLRIEFDQICIVSGNIEDGECE